MEIILYRHASKQSMIADHTRTRTLTDNDQERWGNDGRNYYYYYYDDDDDDDDDDDEDLKEELQN